MMNVSEASSLEDLEETIATVVPIFFGLIAVTGLFGNLLVIFVVLWNPQMRSTTNLLIVNLAVSDLLFVVFCIPFTATDYAIHVWPFGVVWCKIVQYLIVVTFLASVYTLVLMSLDRFFAVVHPVASRSIRTQKNIKITIGILWISILAIAAPVMYLHGVTEVDYRNQKWSVCQYSSTSDSSTYQVIFFIISYLIPLILISTIYVIMIIQLWESVPKSAMSADSTRGRKRATRMVVIVVTAFTLLWLPIQVIMLLKSQDLYGKEYTHFSLILQIVSQIVAYFSSCINPLLYAFLSPNFRKAFYKAMNCSSKYTKYDCPAKFTAQTTENGRLLTVL